MRTLQVMAGAANGGAETFFVEAVSAVCETSLQQSVLLRANNPHRLAALRAMNIPVHTASFDKTLYCPTQQKLTRCIKEFDPDIVHHWLGRAGSFAVKGCHINLGWYGAYYHPKYFSNCDHHVAVTRDVADHIIRHGIPANRVHVLHLYSECKNVPAVSRATLDTPDEAPLLLSLARLHPVKGLDILLQAMKKIPEAYLWLAGSGPLEASLKETTRALGLEERIRFLGWRNDREALLATADMLVFPSRNDSFGAVILEGWATRTPIIATKAPGPRAYIKHEQDGLLVEIDDVEGFAGAVNRLINENGLASSLAEKGFETYQKGFTKEIFKKNITTLYELALR